MKATLSALPILAGATLAAMLWANPASAQTTSSDADLVAQGRYVAEASDCVACHTKPGHAPFTGGVAFTLPMGTLYSTNITPDPKNGIGAYTEADFSRALRRGIRRDGASIYPAMPFPSYARLTDQDIHALYIYFRDGVKADPVATPANKIPWPLSMRFPLTIWRWLFAPDPARALATTAHEFSDPELARGAYLVEGPGHCGACHTPRGLFMQEKTLTASAGKSFVSGGAAIDGWIPPTLRDENRTGLGRWSEDQIVAFLKTGRNEMGESFGGMSDAIAHGTQHLTDADLHAMAKYLKTLEVAEANQANWVYENGTANAMQKADFSATGARVYVDNCAACHRTDGRGYPATFPPLAGNPIVMSKDPASLIHIILAGATLPGMNAAPSAFTMPALRDRLSDQEIADVVTFIRHAWGNNAPEVTRFQVTALRKSLPTPDPADNLIPLN